MRRESLINYDILLMILIILMNIYNQTQTERETKSITDIAKSKCPHKRCRVYNWIRRV